jgi:hypothetical protein
LDVWNDARVVQIRAGYLLVVSPQYAQSTVRNHFPCSMGFMASVLWVDKAENNANNVVYHIADHPLDLTWLFWTKLCEKLSLERSFGYAEEAVQRGADRGGASSDRSVAVAGQGNACGLPGSRNFAAELLSLAQGIWRT